MSKKRNLIFLALLILGILLITSCLPKPPVTEGILKGQVIVPEGTLQTKDLTGQALPNATINIIDLATGEIIATTTTDANGYYQVLVPAGGPYLLEAIKDGIKVQQVTPQIEVGIEYDLGTADCSTTSVALIAQAMMDTGDNLADINLTAIQTDPNFNDVSSIVCSIIEAGGDPAVSALVQQAVEDFLNPTAPTPNPHPTPLSIAKTITAFDFIALNPDVVGVINEAAKTIALTVPSGTNLTALVPTIVHTGVSVSPASGAAQDFTSPVSYTVTAEDASTQAYLVTVTVAAPVIETDSTIADREENPTVNVTGTNFKADIDEADLIVTVTAGGKNGGLVLYKVSFKSATEIEVAFTGMAKAGDVITIQAITSAFDPVSVSASNTLTITVPEPTIINIAAIPGVTAPITGEVPVTAITATAQYTGTVTWSGSPTTFAGSTIYTATIILTVKAGYTLTGVTANYFTVAGAAATNDANLGVITAVFPITLVIGANYQGGKIAYILQSGDPGYDASVQHGLIAALANQDGGAGIAWITGGSTQATWVNGVNYGGTSTTISSGQANTNAMMDQTGYTGGAAKICDDYTNEEIGTGIYSDWFLPSINELHKLWENLADTPEKRLANGFPADIYYWSSSEVRISEALILNFNDHNEFGSNKDNPRRVRAVRYF